jgi:hypothetical protein
LLVEGIKQQQNQINELKLFVGKPGKNKTTRSNLPSFFFPASRTIKKVIMVHCWFENNAYYL